MQISVKKLTGTATIPTYATTGAACFDIYADLGGSGNKSKITHQQAVTIGTGLAFDIPESHVMLIFGRSGLAFKEDIRLANCVGVIDSDYRGELMVKMARDSVFQIRDFDHGDRIAQGMVIPVERVTFMQVAELSETDRGADGLGSTGK